MDPLDRTNKLFAHKLFRNDNKVNALSILSQNIANLKSKIDQIEILLEELQPSLVCFTELGMSEHELELLSLNNYTLVNAYSRKRNKNKQSGGVGIFCRNNSTLKFNVKPLDIKRFLKDKIFEASAIKIVLKDRNIVLVNLYRSSNQTNACLDEFFLVLDSLLNYLLRREVNFILCGDLNIDLLLKGTNQERLIQLMNAHGLRQFINEPTRVT